MKIAHFGDNGLSVTVGAVVDTDIRFAFKVKKAIENAVLYSESIEGRVLVSLEEVMGKYVVYLLDLQDDDDAFMKANLIVHGAVAAFEVTRGAK